MSEQDPVSHWFGSLDPDTYWDKKNAGSGSALKPMWIHNTGYFDVKNWNNSKLVGLQEDTMKLSDFLEEAAIMKEMKHPNLVQVSSTLRHVSNTYTDILSSVITSYSFLWILNLLFSVKLLLNPPCNQLIRSDVYPIFFSLFTRLVYYVQFFFSTALMYFSSFLVALV
jgi:hypothetical protein